MFLNQVCNKSAKVSQRGRPVGVLIRDEACGNGDWAQALAALEGFALLMKGARTAVKAMEMFESLAGEVEHEQCDLDRLTELAERTEEEAKKEDGV